jgi:hypothetical protein
MRLTQQRKKKMATRYTLQDASGSYSWMVENLDRSDYQLMTDDEIASWVNDLIDATAFDADLDNAAEGMPFPRFGYTTAQRFENADEWVAFKKEEMLEDVEAEREAAIKYLKHWIAEVIEA